MPRRKQVKKSGNASRVSSSGSSVTTSNQDQSEVDNTSSITDDEEEYLDEDHFVVENIIGKRVKKGKIQYRIKWKGYGSEHNTWEPVENCENCMGLVDEYEKNLKIKSSGKGQKPGRKSEIKYDPTGFARGLQPEKIFGATDVDGDLCFLVKWANSEEADLVPAEQVYDKCSILAFKFFEKHLVWKDKQSNETDAPMIDLSSFKCGLERNLPAEKIIGARDESGKLLFLMKWKNMAEYDLVDAQNAYVKCPQVVLKYYMDNFKWINN